MAIISASRDKHVDCLQKPKADYIDRGYTPEENEQRNKTLKAACLEKGYGVTKIRGGHAENFNTPEAIEVQEESFVVVNLNDDPNFVATMIRFGKAFCQDAVLVKEVGKDAYLHGTNRASFPGLGNTVLLGGLKGGKEAQVMSGENGKGGEPFVPGEGELPYLETVKNYGWAGRLAISLEAKKMNDYDGEGL